MSLKQMLHSFVGGEWSPSLHGRVDLAKYVTAVRTMKNFFPHPHGGASNRSGLEFIHQAKVLTSTSANLFEVDSHTKMLLHCNGANGSTTITDECGHTVTVEGDAEIDTSEYLYGGAALKFDGTGDYAVSVDHSDFNLADSSFCFDFAVKFASLPAVGSSFTLISQWALTGNQRGWLIQYKQEGATTGRIYFYYSTDGYSATTKYFYTVSFASSSMLDWQRIAVWRDGASMSIAIEGTKQTLSSGSTSYNIGSDSIFNGTANVNLGSYEDGTGNFLNGWIDEVRLSDIARYSDNFTYASPETFVRLIPFKFSVTQTYILEFGDMYMRVYKDGGIVLDDSDEIYEIQTPYKQGDLSLLKYEQSADVLYLWHPSYSEYKLTRTDHDAWTITATTFAPSISAPSSFSRTSGSGTGFNYVATAVASNGEESVASSSAAGGRGDTFGWDAVTGADHYNVYEDHNGVYYYIGEAGSNSFVVPSSPDVNYEYTPPKATNPLNGSGNYAGCGAFHQQRLYRARTNNKPQTLFGSCIGSFDNMNISSPIQDDDAVEFTLNAKMVNEIRWIVALNNLLVGTSDSEWTLSAGDTNTTITPTAVMTKVQSRWGSSHVLPIVIGNTVLFVDSSGKVVRDLVYSIQIDGYEGNNLTILANHLFEGKQIVDWAYQKNPDSIIWCVMDDGSLTAITYNREHEIWGWHRHETDGEFESVASISTDYGTDEVYFVVKRTINGSQVRYVERLSQRLYSNALQKTTNDIQDAFFVDSGLSLDIPLEITGATQADPVVITCESHGLSNGDEIDISDVKGMTELNGNRYTVANVTTDTFELDGVDGSEFSAYTSSGYVRKAVTTVTGLDHLEGEEVVVLANGSVITGLTVASGEITLPNKASRVHVGLSYTCDLETMEIEYPTKEGSVQGNFRDIESAVLKLRNTREIWIGGSEDYLEEVPFRTEEDYGDPIDLFTGDKDVLINNGGSGSNRVFIRVQSPLPATVLAIVARTVNGE